MRIQIWGTDFRRSSSELRTQLFIAPEERERVLGRVREHVGLSDLVYLPTCNRVEFYCTAPDHFGDFRRKWEAVLTILGASPDSYYSGYHFEGKSAVRHILRLASSLESMVIGEPQILGQLKDVFRDACREVPGPQAPLRRVFQLAFEVAKKVRTQTSIGSSNVSVASLALARMRTVGDSPTHIVLVGRSPMTRVFEQWFSKNTPNVPMTWVNRDPSRLVGMTSNPGVQFLALDEFLARPFAFSHLITATASDHVLFSREWFERLPVRPSWVVDLAQPADVERVDSIRTIRIEDLAKEAAANSARRQDALLDAEALIEESMREFFRARKEAPLLRDFSLVEPSLLEAIDPLMAEAFSAEPLSMELRKFSEKLVRKSVHQSREHLRRILREASEESAEPH